MRVKNVIRRQAIAWVAVASLSVSMAAANATSAPTPTPETASQEPIDPSVQSDNDAESLVYPIVSAEMSELAGSLNQEFASHRQFASAEVTLDRTRIIVHWYGDPTAQIREATMREPTVAVEYAATAFEPGALREAAQELIETNSLVKGVAIEHDGSGLVVSLEEPQAMARRGASPEAQVAAATDFPVAIEYDAPVPASTRQFDYTYHLGGARIRHFDNGYLRGGCTSGFSVTKPGTTPGSMTAAHCGSVGSVWVASDGMNAYLYGNMTERNTAYDGAILSGSFSSPYMWNGAWDTEVYNAINGSKFPYVGMELCYNGSYSGLKCGNMVTVLPYTYSLGGDLTSVTGFRTLQASGEPAAGNGDSGGPGYELTVQNGYIYRSAVGIISAIPSNSPDLCNGVPGTATRRCSPTVISTSVVQLEIATGWTISTP